MIKVECLSPEFKITEPTRPDFRLVKAIPSGLAPQIENAVRDFMVSSHLPEGVDKEGFYRQTLQSMAAASYLSQGGDLWLGTMNGQLVAYSLCQISNDYDGRLAYTATQSWIRKDQRGQPWVKWAWDQLRQRAKDCLCKHFATISSRGRTKAYCRFLGKGFRPYAEILKEEL